MKTNDPAPGDWRRPGRSRGQGGRGDRSGTVNLGVTPDTRKLTVEARDAADQAVVPSLISNRSQSRPSIWMSQVRHENERACPR
jgi:hypothetical protein